MKKIITLDASSDNQVCYFSVNPTSYAPLHFVMETAFTGGHELQSDVSTHLLDWTHSTNGSVSGGGVLPVGGMNPFLATGHASMANVRTQYMGGTLSATIVSNYNGMAECYSYGADEAPRVVGRRQTSSHAANSAIYKLTHNAPPVFGNHVVTTNDLLPYIAPQIIGGSQRMHIVLPMPPAHHNFVSLDDQTDGQANTQLLHTGSYLACLQQGMGGYAVKGVGGVVVVMVECVVEHQVSIDEDSLFMAMGSTMSRPVTHADRVGGGFGGSGTTANEALNDSVEKSTAYAEKSGALTKAERAATIQIMKKKKAADSSSMGVVTVPEKSEHGFLDTVTSFLKFAKVAIPIAQEIGEMIAVV